MIGDLARRVIIDHTNTQSISPRPAVALLGDLVVKTGCTPSTNRKMCYTNGFYMIKYNNISYRKKPYQIYADIFDKRAMHFESYEQLVEIAKTDDKVFFILKYTNASEELFRIAKKHINLQVPLAFDIIKYEEDVAEKLGVDNEEIKYRTPEYEELELKRLGQREDARRGKCNT